MLKGLEKLLEKLSGSQHLSIYQYFNSMLQKYDK